MNDLMYYSRIEDQFKEAQYHRLNHTTTIPSSSSAHDEGKARDTYEEGTNAGCSVHRLGANSTGGFWGLFLGLFGLD